MADAFCLAQLSDPHLSDLSGVSAGQLVSKRLLGYISWRRKRRLEHRPEMLGALGDDLRRLAPDHTVVTGDLTHISLPHEFVEARRWLESLGEPEQVTAIPGNHDAYVAMPWAQGQGQWGAYMRSDDSSYDGPDMFPSVRRRGPIAIIGTSSAVPVGPGYAKGSLGTSQLERLRATLDALRTENLFRILLIHHPPVPGEEKWRKRLTDAEQLCALLREHPVDLVLHGHRHRALQSVIPGTRTPVFGIPSSSAAGVFAPSPAEYNVYRLQQAGRGWQMGVYARRFVADGQPFIEHQLAQLESPSR